MNGNPESPVSCRTGVGGARLARAASIFWIASVSEAVVPFAASPTDFATSSTKSRYACALPWSLRLQRAHRRFERLNRLGLDLLRRRRQAEAGAPELGHLLISGFVLLLCASARCLVRAHVLVELSNSRDRRGTPTSPHRHALLQRVCERGSFVSTGKLLGWPGRVACLRLEKRQLSCVLVAELLGNRPLAHQHGPPEPAPEQSGDGRRHE